MSRYLPIILGVLAIVGLTIPQIVMSDRFAGANFSAEQQAKLLDNVPMEFGDWVGENMAIDKETRRTAGAIGAVSRNYRNSRTGEDVKLWLIVGHARVISAHTPDICFRSSGFTMRAPENSKHPFAFEGQSPAQFWTNTFVKEDATGRQLVRVFWSWYNPSGESQDGRVHWEAPTNSRWHFGNTRAVYKMYFTSNMRDPKETTEQSPCVNFAREFLPIVDEALTTVYNPTAPAPSTGDEKAPGEKAAEPAALPAEPTQG